MAIQELHKVSRVRDTKQHITFKKTNIWNICHFIRSFDTIVLRREREKKKGK